MTMRAESRKDQDVLDVRRTVALAEALLSARLGACRPCAGLCDLYQWDADARDYGGLSLRNPQMVDIKEFGSLVEIEGKRNPASVGND
jgi:hypothetical protein